MNYKPLIAALGLALSANTFAFDDSTPYKIIPGVSSASFSTIKNQYIVESASINVDEGVLEADGEFSLTLPLNTLETGISIRDTRLKELFFEIAQFPSVVISGKIDWKDLSNDPKKLTIPVKVSMYGKSKEFDFPVVAVKVGERVFVSSYSQVVIKASDFGIPSKNLTALADTVGGIKISDNVPLSFTLSFERR